MRLTFILSPPLWSLLGCLFLISFPGEMGIANVATLSRAETRQGTPLSDEYRALKLQYATVLEAIRRETGLPQPLIDLRLMTVDLF